MAKGPNEARFETSLRGASWEAVGQGAAEWDRCARLLDTVALSLSTAAKKDQQIGGETGPAMGAAFRRTSTSVSDRADLLREGKAALESASRALKLADKGLEEMNRNHPAMDHPGTWQRPVGPLDDEDLKEQSKHQQQVNDFQETYAARERISQHWTEHIDTVFADSTETMKKVHGEPDPTPPPPSSGSPERRPISTTPGTPQGPGDHSDDRDPRDPEDDHDDNPGDDDPRDPEDDHDDDTPGDDDGAGDGDGDSQDTPEIDTDHGNDGGGLSAGTLGGLAAGAGAGALALRGLRGGLLPSALSSTGARPIGSTGRYGASGPLGRSGALAPGSPVTRGAVGRGGAVASGSPVIRGAAGRGAAGRGGAGAGGIGTRGGRGGSGGKGTGGKATGGGRGAGAGGIGTGRGRGKKDEEEKPTSRDLFDDGEDWIDDEGAAPDVLD